ncbi:MAG: AMP-binding protein [Victivallaceae bacterium]|nr:AMP-binding protein [Victivallaceae bacterium]
MSDNAPEDRQIPNRREGFEIPAPKYYNFAYDYIDKIAQSDRNKQALLWVNQNGEERRYTFYDMSVLSNQAANLLLRHGIGKGDPVMLMLPRVPEWWIFSLALIKLGAVQCPSPCLLTSDDLRHRMGIGKFKMVITNLDNAPKIDAVFDEFPFLRERVLIDGERAGWINYQAEINSRVPPSRHHVLTQARVQTLGTDPLLMIFTSGTKSPKLVLHNCVYPLAHLITAKMWQGLTSNDLHYVITDTGWGKHLWSNYFGQWLCGACLFVYDFRGKFNAENVLLLLQKYGITSFCAPPTAYRMIVLDDLKSFDLSELKHCTAAGEPLHPETVRLWREGTGLTIHEGYGQTETPCMIGCFRHDKVKAGSMGRPSPYWDIRLLDDDGVEVKTGEEGRIAVNLDPPPPGLLVEYVNNPEANAECFHDGYYFTGDKAWKDEDGYFWFIGRVDDIIKSSGYRIGPAEVEDALLKHPAVVEAAVIGVPDVLRGTRVKAYIVLNPGFEPTETLVKDIQNHTKRVTAPYKYPREIEFVEELPKTFAGKVKRDVLRKHSATGEMWKIEHHA